MRHNIEKSGGHLILRHGVGKFGIHNGKLGEYIIAEYASDFLHRLVVGNNRTASSAEAFSAMLQRSVSQIPAAAYIPLNHFESA